MNVHVCVQTLGKPLIESLLDLSAARPPRQDLEEDEVSVPAAGLIVGMINKRLGWQGLQDLEFVLPRYIKHLHQGLMIEVEELLQARVTHPLAQSDTGQRHGCGSSRLGR